MSVFGKESIKSLVVETKLLDWKTFEFIQQDDFKSLTEESKVKLKASILNNNFTQPFYVWLEPETNIFFCLDGMHRCKMLRELEAEGNIIPNLLPATLINCENKKEAAKLVLIYSSVYANITQQGLFDFLNIYDLEYKSIIDTIEIPEFSEHRFEQHFDLFDVNNGEEPEAPLPSAPIVKAGDIFEINGHRIICGSFREEADVTVLMQDDKARIVNCDPPYNLPANFFTNKEEKRHTNFAMGAGEMSHDEFVEFLALIMQRSKDNSVAGAIHYIFMDFRHMWHMTEAARKVYDNPEPKQVCVWVKDMMANGSFYRAQHELCFIFNDAQSKHQWNNDIVDYGGFYKNENELCYIFKNGGDEVKHLSNLALEKRIRTNVWRYPSATSTANPDRLELKNHPTPKPVVMIADAILDTTNEGDIVIDWFLGSGTCLIACEHTKRFGRFTEIEPKYVQSAIVRFISYCSKKGINITFSHINGSLTVENFKDAR